MPFDPSRRIFLTATGVAATLSASGLVHAAETKIGRKPVASGDHATLAGADAGANPTAIRRVRIPRSGELLPVIGLGTSRTFDADPTVANEGLVDVMRRFYAWGGSLIDSSPMYRRSEEVVGVLNKAVGRDDLFYATKVWTDKGREAGMEQMQNSAKLMGTPRFDLMQVHNLVGLEVQLQTLKQWREQGKVRYIGVTEMRDFETVEKLVSSGEIDFIQIPYSVGDRRVESRLLPACVDHGVAVLVMRPYERGKLFGQVKGKALPEWAAEFGAASWGQLFLKFILGHKAAMLPIPATSKSHHLDDNMAAGLGPVLDEAARQKLADLM
jgi:diketogulonate reductase-like aldo/keto reductase